MAPVEWADEAARMVEAGKARSVSEVYRLWMERGRTLAQASG
jgi:hypothetical protein